MHKQNFSSVLVSIPKHIDRIIVAAGYVGSYMVVGGMLVTTYHVVLRYVFHSPTLFAYDTSRWVFYYSVLLMAAWILRDEGHIRIDVVLLLLKARPRAVLESITSVLIIIACTILFYQGIVATAEDFTFGMLTNTTVIIPRFFLFMGVPIGSFLLICQAIRRAKRNFDKLAALPKE